MTNQLTPQELLEIARVVEPDKEWILCGFGRDVISANNLDHVTIFQPHKTTERGQAQLMTVVFEVAKKSRHKDQEHALLDCIKGLLSLAHEVLCN